MQRALTHPDGVAKERKLTFPIKLRCTSVEAVLAEPGLEAALTRVLGRAFAKAQSALPAERAVGAGIALRPPHFTSRNVSGTQAAELLSRVQRAIDAAARALPIPSLAVDDEHGLVAGSCREIAEAFDPKRFDSQTASYEIPSYKGGTKKVPAQSQAGPFDRLLSLLGTAYDTMDQFIKDQFTLSGIANQRRRDQWDEMQRALADLAVERKATQTVADVLARKLKADKVTGPDRNVADGIVKKYTRENEQFPAGEPLARREAQMELGNTLLNVVRGRVKELDRKAAEHQDEASRNAFLDAGSYYLELIGVAPQIGVERLAFLETFYGDPEVILVYAVLRFIRQELPELWDNLKHGTVFALSDIGNTNMLSNYALGFAPGSSEAAEIVVINRALWIQGELYDQQGSQIYSDLPKSQNQVTKVPEARLASLLSANILQFVNEVPVLILLKSVQLQIDAIRKDYRVGVSGWTGNTSVRDAWLKELEIVQDEVLRRTEKAEAPQFDRRLRSLEGSSQRIAQSAQR